MRVIAGERLPKGKSPLPQLSAFLLDRRRFVADVVGDTHEGVESAHRPALGRGQDAKRRVEVARLAPRQRFAVVVRAGQRGSHLSTRDLPAWVPCPRLRGHVRAEDMPTQTWAWH